MLLTDPVDLPISVCSVCISAIIAESKTLTTWVRYGTGTHGFFNFLERMIID